LVSPRKYLGVPDGAILTSNNKRFEFKDVALSEPPGEWWMKAFATSMLRREFDACGESNRWYELYQDMDATHPIGRYSMSQLSRVLLSRGFDYSNIIRQRVNNYRTLASRLAKIAIFSEIPDGVVPLGFPVRLKNRDEIRQALIRECVYSPIHWSIKGVVPDTFIDSHRLSNEIMTLPCDQRYDVEDMERVARLVRKEMAY
jgi:dTDP-4-amino-4,6-dideoxygalactose transaminase